ncbi:MAG: HIT family protein [Candidatus Kuenenbacteria bacterium]
MSCIFCKIIAGEIPADKVYEDHKILAFLDISPVNKGHVLIIPKEHYENLMATPDELVKDLWAMAKKIAKAVQEATGADGINFGSNNGKAAGQIVFHTHIHVIPRFKDDGLIGWPNKKYEEGEQAEMAGKVRNQLTRNN